MKNNGNGITLIALIITIIVMLILVGVTINVALNGGLFDKAKTTSDQTNLAKEKEILQTKALGYLNNSGYVDLAEFVSKESPLEGYTLTNNEAYVTASNGTNTFYITKQGGITETEPQVNIDDLIPTAQQKEDVGFEKDGEFDLYSIYEEVVTYNEYNDNIKFVVVSFGDGKRYYWACDDATATLLSDGLSISGMQAKRWYYKGDGTLYTGACPINKSSLNVEDIRNEEYLDRVITSFSSTNN